MSGAALPAGARPVARRSASRRTSAIAVALAAAVGIAGFAAGRSVVWSLALFTSRVPVGANVLTAGTWVVPSVTWCLHNRPTPPVGNTTAQVGLTMDEVLPTAATLYNYDTNADTSPGRRLVTPGAGPTDTNTAAMTSWMSPALAAARAISGTVTVTMFSATANFATGRGGLVAYLRDYTPGSGTYVEIGNGTLNQGNWQGGSSTWVAKTIVINVATTVTVALGHRIELKVEASPTSPQNMWIAYDTATRPSSVTLP